MLQWNLQEADKLLALKRNSRIKHESNFIRNKNLEASIENKQIIKNFNLTINKMKFMSSWVQMVQVKVLSQNF
jgi:hypothetical protein